MANKRQAFQEHLNDSNGDRELFNKSGEKEENKNNDDQC